MSFFWRTTLVAFGVAYHTVITREQASGIVGFARTAPWEG